MIKANFIVISGDSQVNWFMKAADIFDNGKIVATINEMEVSFKEGEEVTFERCEKLIPILKEGLAAKQVIALIHLKSIVYENNKTLFNNTVEPYVNKFIREISVGIKHIMFYKILQELSISFELTEHMYIV